MALQRTDKLVADATRIAQHCISDFTRAGRLKADLLDVEQIARRLRKYMGDVQYREICPRCAIEWGEADFLKFDNLLHVAHAARERDRATSAHFVRCEACSYEVELPISRETQ